ncbi:hypothetical protein AQI84_00725 [Streptomyces griseorubiginosus]|nr:hypothetical protein AQI84_00725 [Streptomyces griseorubiginosus]
MAAYWLAAASVRGSPYTAGPHTWAVSVIPARASIRGGASGATRCSSRAEPVSRVITLRIHR